MARALFRIVHDTRGATVVEFAMIAPVLLTTLLGLMDLGHTLYTNSMLQGAIQQAARNSTLEGAAGQAGTLDAIVTSAVRKVAPHATLSFQRKAYTSFADVARPEDFADADGDGACNNGEAFEDVNGNGNWDADRGSAGFGGARDAVLYTVNVSYPRLLPIAAMIPGQSSTMTLQTSTVLRNQPFGDQYAAAPKAGNCP